MSEKSTREWSGGGGIRTHGPRRAHRFSRPTRSTAPAPRRGVALSQALVLDALGRAVRPQHVGNIALEVLEDRKHGAVGRRRAVERVHRLEVLAGAIADAQSPRLEVGRVRRRRQLAVALLAGEPAFAVVLLRGGRAEVAGGDVD